MKIELIFLELLIGSMILGGIIAHKRSVGERLLLFISIPISFLLSFIITKLGIFDGIGRATTNALLHIGVVKNVIGGSTSATTAVSSLIAVIVRPAFVLIFFWLLLLVFKLVVSAIAKRTNKGIFEKPQHLKEGKNIASIALGVVGAFVIVMLSCFPFDFLSNMAEPAIMKATEENYKGTYIYDVAKKVDENYLPTSKTENFGKLQYYTGMRAIMDAVSDSLSQVTLTTNSGKVLKYNATHFVQDILKDEVDLIALYDHLNSPGTRSGSELNHITNVVNTLADSNVVLAVFPELISATTVKNELINDVIQIVSKEYNSEDVTLFASDLEHLSKMISTVAEGAKNEKLSRGSATRVILNSLSKSDVSRQVADQMSEMHIYNGTMSAVTDFGVEYLCDVLKVDNKEEIMSAIKKKESYSEADNDAFAKMISTASLFASKLDGESESTIGVILSSFSLVGRLLDAFHEYEPTSELPAMFLVEISNNEVYGNYFVGETVVQMTENVKAGTSTYEELFSSVQAVYNIVNQAIKESNI